MTWVPISDEVEVDNNLWWMRRMLPRGRFDRQCIPTIKSCRVIKKCGEVGTRYVASGPPNDDVALHLRGQPIRHCHMVVGRLKVDPRFKGQGKIK